jgi:hypothetical protein
MANDPWMGPGTMPNSVRGQQEKDSYERAQAANLRSQRAAEASRQAIFNQQTNPRSARRSAWGTTTARNTNRYKKHTIVRKPPSKLTYNTILGGFVIGSLAISTHHNFAAVLAMAIGLIAWARFLRSKPATPGPALDSETFTRRET